MAFLYSPPPKSLLHWKHFDPKAMVYCINFMQSLTKNSLVAVHCIVLVLMAVTPTQLWPINNHWITLLDVCGRPLYVSADPFYAIKHAARMLSEAPSHLGHQLCLLNLSIISSPIHLKWQMFFPLATLMLNQISNASSHNWWYCHWPWWLLLTVLSPKSITTHQLSNVMKATSILPTSPPHFNGGLICNLLQNCTDTVTKPFLLGSHVKLKKIGPSSMEQY